MTSYEYQGFVIVVFSLEINNISQILNSQN